MTEIATVGRGEASGSNAPLTLGVVLVSYNSADVILPCLESLLSSKDVRLAIQIVDNGSTDDTALLLHRWAAGEEAIDQAGSSPVPLSRAAKPLALEVGAVALSEVGHSVALFKTGENLGFAGGVNRGLEFLAQITEIDRFWILNPDTIVPDTTAHAFATHPEPLSGFALMGGRVLYADCPDMIQIDGGTVNRWTGVTGNLNQYAPANASPPEDGAADFVSGCSMVASRVFYETVGPMREDYFLYYEEVDWALRRGDLPLIYCAGALVYHTAGTAIGSGSHSREATPFSVYFKHRARLMFLRRFYPAGVLTSWCWTIAKSFQMVLKSNQAGAIALLAGAAGQPVPQAIAAHLSPEARARLVQWKR